MSRPYSDEPSVDELVAAAEERQRAGEAMTAAMSQVTGSARSQDGMVAATVTSSGELRELWLHPSAVQLGADALGRAITATAQQAAEFAAQRSFNVLAQALGDELTAVVEGLGTVAPARAAGWDTAHTVDIGLSGSVPSRAARPAGADEDDDALSFDPSSLRSDR